MNILIDFTQIPLRKCGIGIYALNLIFKIHELDKKNIYYIIMQDDDDSLNFISHSRFNIIRVKSKFFRKFIFRLFLEQIYIPYLALKHKIDVVHSLHYSFPLLLFARRIVTVPDMTFFRFPRTRDLIRRYYFKFFLYLASIFPDKIITISKSSLDDFLKKFKIDRNKAHVIYLGKSTELNCNLDKTGIELIKNKYKIDEEYILFLGTIEPRKNINNLILAFHRILGDYKNYQLVIAGRKGWRFDGVFRLVEDLSLGKKVIFTGFIDEKEKPFLIAGAKIFVYPSTYEGFGIPVLESLSCGIPTITSNVSSLPEIAQDAALLIDPLNIDELYLNIKKLFDDYTLYAQLKQRSIEQARKFSWERCARETIGVYNSLE